MSSCVTTFHCENTCAHEVFHSSKRTKFCTAPWWMPATLVVSGGQHLNSLARCTWMLWEPTLWLEMTCISQMCNIVQQWKIFKMENMECHAILCVSSYVLTICVSSQQTFVFPSPNHDWMPPARKRPPASLRGGFTYFLFSTLPGEMIHFDYISTGLKPPRMWWYTVLPSVHVNKMAPGWKHCNWWTAPWFRSRQGHQGNMGVSKNSGTPKWKTL